MRIAILAVGSEGDVRPVAAVGTGLARAGHDVKLASLGSFRELARTSGLDFAAIGIDPFAFIRGDIGQAWMDSMDSPARLLVGVSRAARAFLDRLNDDALAACRGSEAILYNLPLAFSGQTIAEALGVPGIPTAVAPFHPTRAFPSMLMTSLPVRTGWTNRLSGFAAIQLLWSMTRVPENRWRAARGSLPRLPLRNPLRSWDAQGVPWLYGISPSVIPAPNDWPRTVTVSGYWFSPPLPSWQPPRALADFLAAGPAPLYVGFGSMVGADPGRSAEIVLAAIRRTGQRAIIASGWGGMQHAGLPEGVLPIDYAPHEWLFPRVTAAVHHGGAGTTAAALRAGVPSIVVPYFYDQFFWGDRVHALGLGSRPIPKKKLTEENLEEAIRFVLGQPGMRERCREMAGRIERENGVQTAVEVVDRYLRSIARPTTQ